MGDFTKKLRGNILKSLEKRKKNIFSPQQKKLLVIFLEIINLRSTRLNDSIKLNCQLFT